MAFKQFARLGGFSGVERGVHGALQVPKMLNMVALAGPLGQRPGELGARDVRGVIGKMRGVLPASKRHPVIGVISVVGLLDEAGDFLGEDRSEEHTSELQSRPHLVCRLLLEKKKKK